MSCDTRTTGDLKYPPCGFNEYGNKANGDNSNSNYNDNDNNNDNGNAGNKHKSINDDNIHFCNN